MFPDGKPIAIAPAPVKRLPSDHGVPAASPNSIKAHACMTCTKRKVKCDKFVPICSSCRKSNLECEYQSPAPRRRKRKLGDDVDDKLARYERILKENGLLPEVAEDTGSTIPNEGPHQEPISLRWQEPGISKTGRIVTVEGKSQYVDSNLWRNLEQDDTHYILDDEDEDQDRIRAPEDIHSDPLTGAFMGDRCNLLQYHPAPADALVLWSIYVENVDPIGRILHIPSTTKMVEKACRQTDKIPKADECLLFAIYYFAVFSTTDEDCLQKFGQSQELLMQRYHFATRQALVNASFLKTTEMSIMQSLVLFLTPARYTYDAHTYWILTGVATRIAQRMGLHRDGEKLGLPPFDVQMRRRLFYQLVPLDGVASRMSGTGIQIAPETWDTQQPWNINDDQIWPGMTETPKEQQGATEMIFCLTRSCVAKYFASTLKLGKGTGSSQFKDYHEAELVIDAAEKEVEERYLRYCNIIDPLHFLTMGLARSAIIAMRLRVRLPTVQDGNTNNAGRKELFQLSQKVLDTDSATYAQPGQKRFRWHTRSFFAYGSWDSLIFVLTTLSKADLLSSSEIDVAWTKMEQVFRNHSELLESKQSLHVAIRRLALKAWDASPPSNKAPEMPAFVTALRDLQRTNFKPGGKTHLSEASTFNTPKDTMSPITPSVGHFDASAGMVQGEMDFELSDDFNLDAVDWTFWDQLIRENQS
ncbi:transcription factor-like protein 15 [Elsinoe australis]|uniref:Transcription factor-like protein 15 n=1 Tax=Elsinoe australis TaxID=40998 RepID=A0A4V6DU62_9PEZI|nr:transcription factor-like protein 15 [Elsinoe australis]